MNEFEIRNPGGFVAQPHPNRSLVELKWNDVSTCELTFDDDSDMLALIEPNSRVRVHRDGEILMTGRYAGRGGRGPKGSTTVRFEDDFAWFRNLGWQNPTAPITGQTAEFARYTGPVETVVKAVCASLSTRLGLGWSIPPSTGLGPESTVEFRMHPAVDKLVELVKADRLTWTLKNGVLNVTRGAVFPGVLTPDSGVIEAYEWSETAPTATRVVLGGSGESTSRDFGLVIDAARELEYGRIVEIYRSASMSEGTSLATVGAEALKETGPAVSVSVDLIEAAWFQYGMYRIGDLVNLKIGALETTDVISRVTFEDSPEAGEVVKPHIGTLETNTQQQLIAAVRKLARGARDAGRR